MSNRIGDGVAVASALHRIWEFDGAGRGLTADELHAVVNSPDHHTLAGLVWRRIAKSDVARRPEACRLRDIARHGTLQSAWRERETRAVMGLLAERQIDALLYKGWSLARLYGDSALRSYSDVDVCVRPDQHAAASEILLASRTGAAIDLHCGCSDLLDRPWDEVWDRAEVAPLGEVSIRMLGRDDLLRQLCLHFWRHEGERPLWLVDIALLLETLPEPFDWDRCLRGRRDWSEMTLAVVGLAMDLLGARLPSSVSLPQARQAPSWLRDAVLWRWGNGMGLPWPSCWREPRAFAERVLFHRWNPLRYSLRYGLRPVWSVAAVQMWTLPRRGFDLAFRRRGRYVPPPPERNHVSYHVEAA